MCHHCQAKEAATRQLFSTFQNSATIGDHILIGLALVYEAFSVARQRLVEGHPEPKLQQEVDDVLRDVPELDLSENDDLDQAMLLLALPAMITAMAKMHGRQGNFGFVMRHLLLQILTVEAFLTGEDDDEPTTAEQVYEDQYAEVVHGISQTQDGDEDARRAARGLRDMAAGGAEGIAIGVDQLSPEQKQLLDQMLGQLEELAESMGQEIPEHMRRDMQRAREAAGAPEKEVLNEEEEIGKFNAGVDEFLQQLQQQRDEQDGKEK